MEEIREQEYISNIPPSKPQQTHQKNEDVEEGGVTPPHLESIWKASRKQKPKSLLIKTGANGLSLS